MPLSEWLFRVGGAQFDVISSAMAPDNLVRPMPVSSDARLDDTVQRQARTERKVDEVIKDVGDIKTDVAALRSSVLTGMKAFAILISLATVILTAVGIFYV